ncbi:MAG: SDR family oxidoreductase [Pseudomonadota bacterium]
MQQKHWALVTGAARRLGREISIALHQAGFNIFIHYNQSKTAADELANRLNHQRQNSAKTIHANFADEASLNAMLAKIRSKANINLLINNAACFKKTNLPTDSMRDWNHLFNTNVKSAFFITAALTKSLAATQGCVINIADIHGLRPYKGYAIYSMTKASLIMLTQALAQELAPKIRVNAIAPSTVLWPEADNALTAKQQTALKKTFLTGDVGTTENVIETIFFLIKNRFVNGEVIKVDGGRSLNSFTPFSFANEKT